ncbi:hypothetical protein ACHHYP_14464 [Achlya hypogyna]|uniref:Reverse transcriptase domain-containing protein n=1 Tax=Achlya hypogyna TaxID=1202772 RepID=A0A1V9YD34_ACHHY|nr:hypothetical protein ACHHYP_14464 [Achlya hypogyna]
MLIILASESTHPGIGFAISPRFVPLVDRLQLNQHSRLNIISAYAPHMGRPAHESDAFYDALHKTYKSLARRDTTVVCGDFNAKLGRERKYDTFMGQWARGRRNRNGHHLSALCADTELHAANTYFRKGARHTTTWTMARGEGHIYNQIDYVLLPRRLLQHSHRRTKTGEPADPATSLRPMVLLNSKAVSLVVLNRIASKINAFVGANQSGLRPRRSTADAIWTHKWYVARINRVKEQYTILGIDVSRAFDTIDRAKLLAVLADDINDDELRLVQLLLTDTTLVVRHNSRKGFRFKTNIGTPQGDSLSPLEAALRDLATTAGATSSCSDSTPQQFSPAGAQHERGEDRGNAAQTPSHGQQFLLPSTRARVEPWRTTKKLGTLLGDHEEVARRKALARMRLRLYSAYVLPTLLYNFSTWALTAGDVAGLESFHRRQLRQVIGIHYPTHIGNDRLYERCKATPLRFRLTASRWSLLGHILRSSRDIPANRAMDAYFARSDSARWAGRPMSALPRQLDANLATVPVFQARLTTAHDLGALRALAPHKARWAKLVSV